MNKKGFEISFSWLFAVIAGMSIFLFLVWFSIQQTDLFGNLTAKVAVEELDIAFTGFKSNLVGSKLDFGKEIELEFKCNSDTLNEERMFINGLAGKKLKGNLVFAPSSMNSDEFRLFTSSLDMPFKITNFIFLNSNKELLNLENMPLDLGKIPDIFNDGSVSGATNPRGYIDDVTGSCLGNSGKKVYYQIDSDTNEAHGTVCIDESSKNFYGTAFVYAAIFADESNFGCIYDNAIEKFNIMRRIYLEKLDKINGCPLEKEEIKRALNSFDLRNPDVSRIKTIQDMNNDMLRKGCESLY